MDGLIFQSADLARKSFERLKEDINSAEDVSDLALEILTQESVGLTTELKDKIVQRISKETSVPPENICLSGSAHLGFAPVDKLNKAGEVIKVKGRPFSLESDLDFSIIDRNFYDSIWERLFEYHPTLHATGHGTELARYHLRGWLRADKMPYSSIDRKRLKKLSTNISNQHLGGTIPVSIAIWRNDLFHVNYFKSTLERVN